MKRGLFISFEGGEGCGKSTHIKALKEYLQKKGFECLITREPGGAPISEKIRDILLSVNDGKGMSAKTEILLFEAARSQHVEQTILPALKAGRIVISDRFMDSTTAYQGAARRLPQGDVEWLNNFAVGSALPDMTILLDLPVEEGLKRANKRDADNADRMGSENIEFYEQVREAFLKLAAQNSDRFAVVSAEGSKEETFAKIISEVERKLRENG